MSKLGKKLSHALWSFWFKIKKFNKNICGAEGNLKNKKLDTTSFPPPLLSQPNKQQKKNTREWKIAVVRKKISIDKNWLKVLRFRFQNSVDCGNFHRLENWLGGSYIEIKSEKKEFLKAQQKRIHIEGRQVGCEKNNEIWVCEPLSLACDQERKLQHKSWQLKSNIPQKITSALGENVKNPSNGKFMTQALFARTFFYRSDDGDEKKGEKISQSLPI